MSCLVPSPKSMTRLTLYVTVIITLKIAGAPATAAVGDVIAKPAEEGAGVDGDGVAEGTVGNEVELPLQPDATAQPITTSKPKINRFDVGTPSRCRDYRRCAVT
jgi:hypothetical protein